MSATPVKIAVDAMGGDFAPGVNIHGALLALEAIEDLHIILVGPEGLLKKELLEAGGKLGDRLEICHAEEIISMEDHAASAVRRKKKSSIHGGLRLVKQGEAHAFISAGNSGAVMGGAVLILGRLSDVERPAIVIKLPTAEGYMIVLDAGANVDCKTSHMVQFGEMGHIYADVVEGINNPRLALISNGSESHKGNEVTREVDALLKKREVLNYIGYVEGNDLFRGVADVIVCDGFVGNIVLKTSEGLADTCRKWFKSEIKGDLIGMLGVLLLNRVLKKFKAKFDYEPYGAAPLLGINGLVLISHGKSTRVAIKNGILTAYKAVKQEFITKIAAHLETYERRYAE